MIRNAREWRITLAAAENYRHSIAAPEKKHRELEGEDALFQRVSIDAMRAKVADLDRELAEYSALTQGSVTELEGRFDQFGELLIMARTARGWSLRELAERLGLKMQQIQEYEASRYERASATRLLDISRALGLTMRVHGTLVDDATLALMVPMGIARRAAVRRASDVSAGTKRSRRPRVVAATAKSR
jgi:transcriptional regulator with XRE-family HTH domain